MRWLALLAAAAFSSLSAPASSAQARPTTRAPAAAPATTPEYHLVLGLRGFAGVLLPEHPFGAGGVSALAALPFARERYEAELSLGFAASRHDQLGLLEAALKRVFELNRVWSPYVLLGPVFSLDFGGGVSSSGGLLAGAGVTYWFHPRVGLLSGLAFRALFGHETREVVSVSLGVSTRL